MCVVLSFHGRIVIGLHLKSVIGNALIKPALCQSCTCLHPVSAIAGYIFLLTHACIWCKKNFCTDGSSSNWQDYSTSLLSLAPCTEFQTPPQWVILHFRCNLRFQRFHCFSRLASVRVLRYPQTITLSALIRLFLKPIR